MRNPRIAYPDALYHVICRGNNRQEIFLNDADRLQYLQALKKVRDTFGLKLFAYVLMHNHVHLLVQTPNANISQAMKWLNWNYCKYFNGHYMRVGHLFENRYKAKLVQKERYLLGVLRYIHLNPLAAGLCSRPESFCWSSYGRYLKRDNSLVNTAEVLALFSDDEAKAVERYVEFVGGQQASQEVEMFKKERNGVIGDKKFHKFIRLQKVA